MKDETDKRPGTNLTEMGRGLKPIEIPEESGFINEDFQRT